MAIFNPDVQKPDKDTFNPALNLSRAITQPEADKSSEIALSTAGSVIHQGTSAADFLTKQFLADEVTAKVEPVRDAYTAGLKLANLAVSTPAVAQGPTAANQSGDAASAAYSTQAPATYAAGTPMDILSVSTAEPVPQDLQAMPNRVGVLTSARANNKLSPTQYIAEIDLLAKDMRARWPGYRDYIDQQFEKLTGMNAANSLITHMISDINSLQQQTQAERTQMMHLLSTPEALGIPGNDGMVAGVKNGTKNMVDVVQFLAPPRVLELQHKLREIIRKESEGDEAWKEKQAIIEINKIASGHATIAYNGVLINQGLTPEKILQIGVDAAQGRKPIEDVDANRLGLAVRAAREQSFAQLWMMINDSSTKDKQGRTLADRAGGAEKVRVQLNAQYGLLDSISESFIGKNYVLANHNGSLLQAMLNDEKYDMKNDKNMGNYIRTAEAIKALNLPQAFEAQMLEAFNTTGLPKDIENLVKERKSRALVRGIDLNTGKFPALKDDVTYLEGKQITLPQSFNDLVKLVEAIPKSPNPEVTANLIDYAFRSDNLGLVSKFHKEGIDPVTGKPTAQGQYSIYTRMLNQDIIDKAWESRGNRQSWDKLKNWAQQTFSRELFKDELDVMKQMPSDLKVSWNTETKQFTAYKVPPALGSPQRYNVDYEHARLKQSVDKVNAGLAPLQKIAEKEGKSVDNYLLQTMFDAGLDPNKTLGVPYSMMQALIGDRLRKAREEEALRSKYKSGPEAPAPAPFEPIRGGSPDTVPARPLPGVPTRKYRGRPSYMEPYTPVPLTPSPGTE